MEESLRAQIDAYMPHLNGLIHRGRRLRDTLAADPSSGGALETTRAWQQACATAVNQLSGGSKAHWLARSYSQAFLVRPPTGRVVEEAPPAQIVERVLDVLEQAVGSLSQMGDSEAVPASSEAASNPRRFEFVHNPELRPVIVQAYADGGRDIEEQRYGVALLTSCGILEAIVTDALEHHLLGGRVLGDTPPGTIADWSFEARLAVAERVGLIHGGWARLPEAARQYRDPGVADGESGTKTSERDARRTRQVLHVVMRDLDPGR
jgi:hypothetical protein